MYSHASRTKSKASSRGLKVQPLLATRRGGNGGAERSLQDKAKLSMGLNDAFDNLHDPQKTNRRNPPTKVVDEGRPDDCLS